MMTMRRLVALSAIALLASCEYPADTELESGTVRWGTSFGMCAGYCKQELAISGANLQLTKTSWDPTRNPPVVQEQAFTDADRRKLLSQVDADKVKRLQDVYGCPDCADGGAEWVEIETPTLKKKVTFEHNKPPAELEDVVEAFRALRGRFPQ